MASNLADQWAPNWDAEPDIIRLCDAYDNLSADPRRSVEELKKLSEAGSIMATLYIAGAYRIGLVGDNVKESIPWYEKAIELGSVSAAYSLAVLYRNIEMLDLSVYYARLGVERGYPPSMYVLGFMYFRGQGVGRDITSARMLWQRGSRLGHVFCRRNLAVLLIKGYFGFWQVIIGAFIWISLVWTGVPVILQDENSWRLAGDGEPRRV